MVDEELQNDDINLDDFNFDDLSGVESESSELLGDTEAADDFNLGDFSFDDLNLNDEVSENVVDDDGRKEPFFEASDDGLIAADESLVIDDSIVENDATDSVSADVNFEENFSSEAQEENPFLDDESNRTEENAFEVEASFDNETEADVVENQSGEFNEGFVEDIENDEADVNIATDNDVSDSSIDEYLSTSDVVVDVESETVLDENVDVAVQEGDDEAGFIDEIPEETPLGEEELPSSEELSAEHESYFGTEDVVNETVLPTDNTSDYWSDDTPYSAISSINEGALSEYLKWYSGQSGMRMFEISKGFDSGNFEADEECKTLHINVGYDTYGWEVQFSDGVVMNLRDVREYQRRNGRLPNPDGRVIYGRSSLLFSGVERIVIYESVRYFSYGS